MDRIPILLDAAREGDVASLERLLHEDPQILHRVTSSTVYVETPLHVASRAGKTEFVGELITRMPSFAIEKDRSEGLIPLHIASASGNINIVAQLLTLNTSLQQCHFKDNSGRIPLHDAVIRGRVTVIEMLINHSAQSLEEVTERGETVLHLAAKNNHSQALQVLIENMKEHENFGTILGARDKNEGKTFWELGQTRENNEIEEEKRLRNAILVVAILIVTMTYNACLTPPPTIWNEERKLDLRCIFKGRSVDFQSPTNTCPALSSYLFMLLNTTAFLSAFSLLVAESLKRGLVLLRLAIVPFVYNYMILQLNLCPDLVSAVVLFLSSFFMLVIVRYTCLIAIVFVKKYRARLRSLWLVGDFITILEKCFITFLEKCYN